MVRPEGRTACCYGTPEGQLLLANDGSYSTSYTGLYSRRLQLQVKYGKTVLRIWPVKDSYLRIQTAWLSSRRLYSLSGSSA